MNRPRAEPHASRFLSRGPLDWLPALGIALALVIVLWPFDAALSNFARSITLAGDLRRELEALAQYGQGSWIVIIAFSIWLLDPARRRRLVDFAAALLLVGLACMLTKLLLGRPRPIMDDPDVLLGPWGMYPVPDQSGDTVTLAHAWDWSSRVQYVLGSIPSRHTAFAFGVSTCLWIMYPVLRWPAAVLACIVGAMRIITGAHWPTDVIAGAALGFVLASLCMRRFWGTRALDWFWRSVVNKNAEAALPRVLAAEPTSRSVTKAASKPSREA